MFYFYEVVKFTVFLHSLSTVSLHHNLWSSTCRKRNCWRSAPKSKWDGIRYNRNHWRQVNTPIK